MNETRNRISFLVGNKQIFENKISNVRDFLYIHFKSGYNTITSVFGWRKVYIFKRDFINQVAYLELNSYIERLVPASLLVSRFINKINSFNAENPEPPVPEFIDSSPIKDAKTSPLLFWNSFLHAASIKKLWGDSKYDDIGTQYSKAVTSYVCTFTDQSFLDMHISQLDKSINLFTINIATVIYLYRFPLSNLTK
ncbi:hypothetical protein AYI68_g4188 [Smittium mucronatum]|uniref:Uncharacterized protein n=1 Tax=Smittium mucronatum TaxID=133383 RepID=A0A1R0GXS8_9FUNG|nr:hypothetical protein AYI68_g4188 [Smittium mucronatum]